MNKIKNPMPQLRAMIEQGLNRIEVDMEACPAGWRYGVNYELKYSGFVAVNPNEQVVLYIKKEQPLKRPPNKNALKKH